MSKLIMRGLAKLEPDQSARFFQMNNEFNKRTDQTAMIVCSCNVISDHEVRNAAASHTPTRMSHVYRVLGRKPNCGLCQRTIKEIAGACDDADNEGRP